MRLNQIVLTTLAILTPLFFVPITLDFFTTPKLILILFATFCLILAWLGQNYFRKTVSFSKSPLTLSLIFIIFAIVVNLILIPEGRLEGIYDKGILFIALSLLSLTIIHSPQSTRLSGTITQGLVVGNTILSIVTILHFTVLKNLTNLPQFILDPLFSPTGSLTTTLVLLGISLGITITHVFLSSRHTSILYLVSTLIQVVAFVITLSTIFSTNYLGVNLLPFVASWSIALDGAKSLRTSLIGIGLANFPILFNSYKPLYLNNTSFWNMLPQYATNEILTLFTTGGLLLLSSIGYFIVKTFSLFTDSQTKSLLALKIGFSIGVISLFIFPATLPIYTTLFLIVVALGVSSHPSITHGFDSSFRHSIFAGLTFLTIASLYPIGRAILADLYMRRAQMAIPNNDVETVYDNYIRAITLVPNLYNYRLSYSQINLSLAGSLSAQSTTPSDADKTQISKFVDVAVREGQVATYLRPGQSSGWQNLGIIYRNLIGASEGVEKLAIENYQKAITVAPGNPTLRVEFGGILLQLANTVKDESLKNSYLSQAISQFQIAIQLKNNYTNAYYNLSKAFESADNIPLAVATLEQAIPYLDQNSSDYGTATAELATLKAKLPTPKANTSETEPEILAPDPSLLPDTSTPSLN